MATNNQQKVTSSDARARSEKGLEGIEKIVYGARYACALPHVTDACVF